MKSMLECLFAHQAWADDQILKAVGEVDGAWADEEIRKLLHHIVTVQRFFLSLCLGREFDMEREWKLPENTAEIASRFAEAHANGAAYTARLDDAELARTVWTPRFQEFHPSVRDVLMQAALHSEHHRAQCASRLRALGGKPPIIDYILWVRIQASAA